MSAWFRQFRSIGRTAFVVTLGTPFSLVLLLSVIGFLGVLGCLPAFTFGEQLRLIRDQSLALCFLGGCLTSSLALAKLVSHDIRQGTAAVMMSRPVSGFCFLAGRLSGVVASLLVMQSVWAIATLWLTRITFHEEHLDTAGLALYAGAILGALLLVALKHYLFGGCYVWQANVAVLAIFALVFALAVTLGGEAAPVDWKTAQGSIMVFLALIMYSGIMTLLAVGVDTGLLLGLSVAVFFGGLLSDYLVGTLTSSALLRSAGRILLPNWQLFWVGETLAEGGTVPWTYAIGCGLHALLYTLVCLLAATFFFNRCELQGSQ